LRVTRNDDADDDADIAAAATAEARTADLTLLEAAAPEPVLATVYYERKMQAERIDVHVPRAVTYIFLYSKAIAYAVDASGCHTSPITVPLIQPRWGGAEGVPPT
jgi:hypothetical protein